MRSPTKGRLVQAVPSPPLSYKPATTFIQLKSKDATGVYALVISAGKKKVSANAVTGEKLGRGVAMKLELAVRSKISGQVAEANGEITTSNGVRVKIQNGKRYLWAASGTGSNLGGHWVEEGTPEALNINSVSKKSINDMQERARAQREGE